MKNVLDKGYIKLVDIMPTHDLDRAVAQAARVSYSSVGDEEADKRLIHRLMRDNHTSPFEMVEFKFEVKAPLIVFWQWVRHRTFQYQSVNSKSGRYTKFEDEFYLPGVTEWRLQHSKNKQMSEGVYSGQINWTEALDKHYKTCYDLYISALDAGIAREQARLFLPAFGVYYTWIVKVNALNLMNFLKLRLADDAQYEIREYAEGLKELFASYMPITYAAFKTYSGV